MRLILFSTLIFRGSKVAADRQNKSQKTGFQKLYIFLYFAFLRCVVLLLNQLKAPIQRCQVSSFPHSSIIFYFFVLPKKLSKSYCPEIYSAVVDANIWFFYIAYLLFRTLADQIGLYWVFLKR